MLERRGMIAPASPPPSGGLELAIGDGGGDPPISTLTNELLAAALYFVPPIDLLRSARLASRRFASCLAATSRAEDVDSGGSEGEVEPAPHFWRCHPLLPRPVAYEAATRPLRYTAHQLQRICLYYAAAAAASSTVAEYPACLDRGSVLPTREEAGMGRPQRACCLATTTDHLSEQAENLLAGSRNIHSWMRRRVWWSSSPSPNPDSSEKLMFVTRCVDTLITRVSILPLRDPHHGRWSYTWRETALHMYRLPIAKAGEEEGRGEVLDQGPPCTIRWDAKRTTYAVRPGLGIDVDAYLAGHGTVYESPAVPVAPITGVPEDEASDPWVRIDLPPGVVANVIIIELRGKHNRQSDSGGYYACVEQVEVLGVPLYTSAPVPRRGEL